MSEPKDVRIRRASHDKENPYYMASRAMAQDESISYDALGVLNYLLSKPDHWEVRPADLERKECGKNKVYKILNELIDAGYMERIYHRDKRQRIIRVEYIVHETKQPLPKNHEVGEGEPFPEKPEMEKPEMGNHDNREYRVQETESPENKDSVSPFGDSEPAQPKQVKPDKVKVPAGQMNPMKDAIALAFRWSWETMTGVEKGMVQKAAKELCLAGLKPDDVTGLYQHCAEQFDNFSPMALTKHVSEWRKAQAEDDIPISTPTAAPEPSRWSGYEVDTDFVVYNHAGRYLGMYSELCAAAAAAGMNKTVYIDGLKEARAS